MICVFAAKNSAGSKVINLRVDMTHKLGHRNRFNRTTYGWEAMRYEVMAHREQFLAVFGGVLFNLLWWALENEADGSIVVSADSDYPNGYVEAVLRVRSERGRSEGAELRTPSWEIRSDGKEYFYWKGTRSSWKEVSDWKELK